MVRTKNFNCETLPLFLKHSEPWIHLLKNRHFESKTVVNLIILVQTSICYDAFSFTFIFLDLFSVFVYKSTCFVVARRQNLIVITRSSHALQWQPSKLRIKQKDIQRWHDLISYWLLNNDSTLFKSHNDGKLKIFKY